MSLQLLGVGGWGNALLVLAPRHGNSQDCHCPPEKVGHGGGTFENPCPMRYQLVANSDARRECGGREEVWLYL